MSCFFKCCFCLRKGGRVSPGSEPLEPGEGAALDATSLSTGLEETSHLDMESHIEQDSGEEEARSSRSLPGTRRQIAEVSASSVSAKPRRT